MAEQHEAESRHAEYYLAVLTQADDLYGQGGDLSAQGLALLDQALGNIRNGQAWAERESQAGTAGLCRFYPMRGANLLAFRFHPLEQIRWGEAALATARQLKDRPTEAILLSNLGMAYEDTGEHQRALDYQLRALEIAREVKARDIEETTLGNLGAAYWSLN